MPAKSLTTTSAFLLNGCGWGRRRRGDRAPLDSYCGFPLHMPGQVFADLAVAIADGADAVTGIEVLRDREALFGPGPA